jgi:hypothetical protein
MFGYYRQILPDILRVFQSTVRNAVFWVGTVLLTLVLALNQHWAAWLRLKTFPPWAALLLLGTALLFALMRASYRRFAVEHGRAERLETEINDLRDEKRKGEAGSLLYDLGPSLEAVLAAADEVWVQFSYVVKRSFSSTLGETLVEQIDRADAGERLRARQAKDDFLRRLHGGDPKPFLVPAYIAYREWREEIMALSKNSGMPILHLGWKDAELRFFGDLRKKLEAPELDREQRAVIQYNEENGPPRAVSRLTCF